MGMIGRLLQRMGRSNRLFPRKLRLTREGKYFVLITLGVGVAAINSGNNLLYLTLGLLLSMIMVSGILSEISLRHVRVKREFPQHMHAGAGAVVSVTVTNHKRMFASFCIGVEEMFTEAVPCSPAYYLHLKAGESRTIYYTLRFPRRGKFYSEGYRVTTRFPFTFFKKSRNIYEEREFVVYPELVSVRSPRMPQSERREGERRRLRIGEGDEFYGLRDYRQGDENNRIHWKASARQRKRVVREFERTNSTQLTLVLQGVAGSQSADIEHALSVMASLARRLITNGVAVGLHLGTTSLRPTPGRRQLRLVYQRLALYDPTASGAVVALPRRAPTITVEVRSGGTRVAA